MINFLPIFHNSPSPTEVIRSTLLMIMQHKYKQCRLHTHTRWGETKRNADLEVIEILRMEKRLWSKQEEVQIVCLQFSLSLSHVCSTNMCRVSSVYFMNRRWIMVSHWQKTPCTHQCFSLVCACLFYVEVKTLFWPHRVCCHTRWIFLPELRWCVDVWALQALCYILYWRANSCNS